MTNEQLKAVLDKMKEPCSRLDPQAIRLAVSYNLFYQTWKAFDELSDEDRQEILDIIEEQQRREEEEES